jgi:hypothetical protein
MYQKWKCAMKMSRLAVPLWLVIASAACGSAPAPIPVSAPSHPGLAGLPLATGAGAEDVTLCDDCGRGFSPDVVGDAVVLEDTIPGTDTIPGIDTVPGIDTFPGTDTIPSVDTTPPLDIAPPPDVGPPPTCPVAVITVEEGEEVIPQTLVHLSGAGSHSPVGTVEAWAWEVVDHPLGCPVFPQPSAQVVSPKVELNCAGKYTFQLTVWDDLGEASCQPALATVVVVPCCGGFHIELLWDTPGDPDQTDEGAEAGSDLDVHLLHPYAQGWDADGDGIPDGWFDEPWDCFWFNPAPEWGSIDPDADDNPSLDRDDTDGMGPENINLDDPEPVTYRVGVHYWSDHGYGPSSATVRVYYWGNMVFEWAGVVLVGSDLWEVCTIDGPTGTVTPIHDAAGEPYVRPDFVHPFFNPAD